MLIENIKNNQKYTLIDENCNGSIFMGYDSDIFTINVSKYGGIILEI